MISILAASFVFFLIGGIWFSPIFFGKLWVFQLNQLYQDHPLDSVMARVVSFRLIQCLSWTTVLYFIFKVMKMTSLPSAIVLAIVIWMGLGMIEGLRLVLFEYRSKRLFLIEQGFWCLGSIVSAAMLILWR